ncbi:MAG: helix-turn-helix domain-containing protein [Chthoniobacterales bacterium]
MKEAYPVSTPIQLSTTLKALRRARGLTQAELGVLLGVSQKRIAWIEASPSKTSFDQISRLVSALGGRLNIEFDGDIAGVKSTDMKSTAASPVKTQHSDW